MLGVELNALTPTAVGATKAEGAIVQFKSGDK